MSATKEFRVTGWTSSNPDFEVTAQIPVDPKGVPSLDDTMAAILGMSVPDMYFDVYSEGCHFEDRDDLNDPEDVATFIIYGMACDACYENDENTEYSCGEDGCYPEPMMIKVSNV